VTSVVPALEPSTVHVWRASLDQDDDAIDEFHALLSDDELERARRFRFARDRNRYVVGRGLLRTLLGRYVDTDARRLRFRYGRFQKPALVGGGPFFNLSHSGHAALYAFSPCYEIGIDIELARPEFARERIAEHFFSASEVKTLRALPDDEQPQAFLACWTRKEAFIKARGDGLSLALDSFDVSLAPGRPAALLRTAWSQAEPSRWQLVDLSDPTHGYTAAIAAPGRNWRSVCLDVSSSVYN
jgi:4'-phosphopantetheinyl transferase